ncbi:hypothetical protein BL8807_03720 [Bifidobacterium lemurum]|nr:nucleoside deaminase [Bifidobacterium lemurum]QOL34996.1 hypothetical protein BL8807_03720 [Bifidobacterium lemurum]
MTPQDAMRQALDLARQAARSGDVPVGAVVLDSDGRIIGRGYNTREAQGDPLAHAEILAMREAAQSRSSQDAASPYPEASQPPASRHPGAAQPASSQLSSSPHPGAESPPSRRPEDSQPASPHPEVSQLPSPRHPERSEAKSRDLTAWNLADCTLVVTLEPCPMCAGACLQTHIGRIIFGAWDAKLGACGSVWDIPRDPHVGHVPQVVGGVNEQDCAALLTDFFAARR